MSETGIYSNTGLGLDARKFQKTWCLPPDPRQHADSGHEALDQSLELLARQGGVKLGVDVVDAAGGNFIKSTLQ